MMKVSGPSASPLRGEASSHLKLRWLKTVVVSVEEKAHMMRQVGTGKASVSEPLMTCRKVELTSKPGHSSSPGMSLAGAAGWPGDVRHGGGASPVCGFCTEHGKASADTALLRRGGVRGVRGSAPSGGNREVPSTDAALAGGPARRSAGINRHGGGDGRALRRRSSDPRRP